jgi:hypothetical protein
MLTPIAFKCFKKYFTFVGEIEKTIMVRYRKQVPFDFMVLDFNLTGLAALWNIVLQSSNQEVTNQAIDFLHSLYEKVSDNLKSEIENLHIAYLNTVMQNICAGTQEESSIERSLLLLKLFTTEYEKKLYRKKGGGPLISLIAATKGSNNLFKRILNDFSN